MDGLELQARLAQADPELTIVLMTAYASVETAVKAMKNGAYDYIVKPFDPDDLSMLVRRAAEHRSLRAENVAAEEEPRQRGGPAAAARRPPPAMRHVIELVADGGRLRRDGADHRRVRHRQGGRGARDPRRLRPPLQPDGRGQLRRAARGHPRERAVRPRGGRVHRRAGAPQGQVRVGRGRHRLPRRDRRREPEGAGRAAARARGEEGHAPRRQRAGQRRLPHDHGHEPRPAGGGQGRLASARTSTGGSTSCTSTSRRCASGRRTCRCSPSTSSPSSRSR